MLDITDPCGLDSLGTWRESFLKHAAPMSPREFPFVVFGNKADLESKRKLSREEVARWCEEVGNCTYIETSAQDDIGVQEGF